MKLQKKITLLCSFVVVLTLLLADAVVLTVSAKMIHSDSVQQGLTEAYAVWSDFVRFTANPSAARDDSVKYYFKTSHDDHTACFAAVGHKELYNNTVFSYRELADGSYRQTAAPMPVQIKKVAYAERRLLVFRMENDRFVLFRIMDLQNAAHRLRTLTAVCLTASALIALTAVLVVAFLLRRSMRPLAKLSAYATQMADGIYSQRIALEQNDEVGQLGREFNKMADAIEKRRDELEREVEKRRFFMAGLTHELKTPLTAISGYAQTMQRTKLSDEQTQFALSYIHSECMRLSRLSRKLAALLALERAEALELTPTSLDALFARAVSICTPNACEREVTLLAKPTALVLQTDGELFTDVLVNLLDNAVKASPPGAQVLLYAEGDAVVVEDRGCGIPAEEMQKIFEPFYTVDRSRSRKNGGTGLGLALSALIADKLGLCLKVESTVGKGTRVTIDTACSSALE